MKLALNGINLGALMLSPEQPKETTREIGARTEAADGSTRVTLISKKNDLSFKTVPLSDADAHAWKCLITGEGETWSFDSSLYGSKGTAPSVITNTTQSAGSAKYGAGKLSVGATTGVITWAALFVNSWGGSLNGSIAIWRFESGAFHHYFVRDDGAIWLDGVRNDATPITWLSFAGGNMTITNVTGSPVIYDDLVAFPFLVLDSWPAQIYAAAVAFNGPPFLLASGDLVKERATREVYGTVEDATYQSTASGVLKSLSVELIAR